MVTHRAITDEQLAEAINLVQRGYSITAAATCLGVAYNTLWGYLRERGVRSQAKSGWAYRRQRQRQLVHELLDEVLGRGV